MTKQELNRDIKRLWKRFDKCNKLEDYLEQNGEFVKELRRLYFADTDFKNCSKESILYLMAMNSNLNAIKLHVFVDVQIK